MVDRNIIECDYCKTKIGLRFQMGYFDILIFRLTSAVQNAVFIFMGFEK